MAFVQSHTVGNFASHMSIEFDKDLGLYQGMVISQSGPMRVVGASHLSVSSQLERHLDLEYSAMISDIERQIDAEERERSRSLTGMAIGMTVNAASNIASLGADAVGYARERFKSNPYVIGGTSQRAKARVKKVQSSGKSKGGIFDDLLSFLGGAAQKPTVYVAMFGGMKVKAMSKKGLKKKLRRVRNKHIQKVVSNVKIHEKERKKAVLKSKALHMKKRVRLKKVKAQKLSNGMWQERLGYKGRDKKMETRLIKVRNKLDLKKQKSVEWAARALSVLFSFYMINMHFA